MRRMLAASIYAAFAIGSDVGAAQLQAGIPQHWVPGDRTAVAELFRAMDAKHKTTNRLAANPLPVTSCADDGSAGTLRSVVSGAGDSDVVDLSGLPCSPIILTNGAILSYADSLTIEGSSAANTVISGNNADRVFVHYGYTSLVLRNLTVRDGFNEVAGYHVAGGACIVSNAVVTLDPRDGSVTGRLQTGKGAHQFFPKGDGRHWFLSNRIEGTLSLIDTKDMTVVGTVRVPGGPDCMDITADGKELWITQRFLRRVAVVDLALMKVVASIPVGKSPHGVFILKGDAVDAPIRAASTEPAPR